MVHTENLNLTTTIFDNGAGQTYFFESHNELRDMPASVGQPDIYERLDFFPDKRLILTTQANYISSFIHSEFHGYMLEVERHFLML